MQLFKKIHLMHLLWVQGQQASLPLFL